jgi:hypothetical protein
MNLGFLCAHSLLEWEGEVPLYRGFSYRNHDIAVYGDRCVLLSCSVISGLGIGPARRGPIALIRRCPTFRISPLMSCEISNRLRSAPSLRFFGFSAESSSRD